MRKMFIRSLVAASFLAGAGGIAAGATAGAAVKPPGLSGTTWSLAYNWTGFGTGFSTWTFNSNHTVTTGQGYTADWSKSGHTVKVKYLTTCGAVYKGTKHGSTMSGTMRTHPKNGADCLTGGVWHATETTSSHSAANSKVSASGRA